MRVKCDKCRHERGSAGEFSSPFAGFQKSLVLVAARAEFLFHLGKFLGHLARLHTDSLFQKPRTKVEEKHCGTDLCVFLQKR